MLHFTSFTKHYGHSLVLEIGTITLPPALYWVQGANGAGKSTLLKAIAGMLYFEGDIVLNTLSLKKNAVSYRRLVNFSEAEPLYPEFLTGVEMIALFRTAKGGAVKQEDYFIESMHMQSFVHQPVGTYSSGMLKKLSLVLAFMGRPQVILLDEPAITLDVDSLKVLTAWIAEMYRKDGISFLVSSHQSLEVDGLPLNHLLVADKTLRPTV